MSIDWKGLKEKKQQELPAAEITRKRRLEDITNKVEKRIYKQCKRQEPGTTVRYSTVIHPDDFEAMWTHMTEGGHWSWDDGIKSAVCENIIDRLTSQGVTCKKVEGGYSVEITLP